MFTWLNQPTYLCLHYQLTCVYLTQLPVFTWPTYLCLPDQLICVYLTNLPVFTWPTYLCLPDPLTCVYLTNLPVFTWPTYLCLHVFIWPTYLCLPDQLTCVYLTKLPVFTWPTCLCLPDKPDPFTCGPECLDNAARESSPAWLKELHDHAVRHTLQPLQIQDGLKQGRSRGGEGSLGAGATSWISYFV